MEKYNILWFDDDFAQVEPMKEFDEDLFNKNETRAAFQRDAELASLYGLNIIAAKNFNQFRTEIESPKPFQAIILDLRGLDEEDKYNDKMFNKTKQFLDKRPNTEIFVYSANTTMPKFELPLDELQEKGHVFNKGNGVDPLFRKILEALDSNMHYYKNFQYILYLFNHQYLDEEKNRTRMDNLLKYYEKNESSQDIFNPMRNILENMLFKLEDIGLIKPIGSGENGDRFNPLMRCLASAYQNKLNEDGEIVVDEQGKRVFDYKNPVLPFETCPAEYKYVLEFLGDITNRFSHFLKENPDYLCRESYVNAASYIQRSTYEAFWAAMKWYYAFVCRYEESGKNIKLFLKHKQENIRAKEFPLEWDEEYQTYHLGEYAVNNKFIEIKQFTIGDKLKILEETTNGNPKTSQKYPRFATKIK